MGFPLSFKVGVLASVVFVLLGVVSMKVSTGPGLFSSGNRYWFILEDADGLIPNSNVKMAGISVGIIEAIDLYGGQAKVRLHLVKNVPLTKASYIELRADGILGNKHVEIVAGDLSAPPLPGGSQILEAKDRGSLESLLNDIGRFSKSLDNVAQTLNNALTKGDRSTPLGRMMLNLEDTLAEIKLMTKENRGAVGDIVQNLQEITQEVNDLINDKTEKGLAANWEKFSGSLTRLHASVGHIESITGKVSRGEGTVGRLLNDEDTVEKLNQTLEKISSFVGDASDIQMGFDYHTEYLYQNSKDYKHYIGIYLKPGMDRSYQFALVQDPEGVSRTEDIVETTPGGKDPKEGDTTERENFRKKTTFKDKNKITATFAKHFYNFTVRGGLLENSGGVGLDYELLPKKLRFSMEFSRFEDTYAKAYAQYDFFKGLYVVGGVDNFLAEKKIDRNSFMGLGLLLDNDDLKFLMKAAF